MTSEDEAERHRLCDILGQIDRSLSSEEDPRALRMAAFALHAAFTNGLRAELERDLDSVGKPLTDSQRRHLRSLGIDPDAHESPGQSPA